MAGYKIQGKSASGTMVDIPLAATYDAVGNDIQQYYAGKMEYEAIMGKLDEMGGQLNLLLASSGMLSFADCSWGAIAAISEGGRAASMFKIGDEKQIILSTGEEITMVIIGFDHDDLTGGGKAGITLSTKNSLSSTYPINDTHTNEGGWKESEMRITTMAMLFDYLPDDVKAVIKPVDKITALRESSGGLEITSDKLFLFSHKEIMGTNASNTKNYNNSYPGEGEQYAYYKQAPIPTPATGAGAFSVLAGTGCFYTEDRAIASGYIDKFGKNESTNISAYINYNTLRALGDRGISTYPWWNRSPYANEKISFCTLGSNGQGQNNYAANSSGVTFGFCI